MRFRSAILIYALIVALAVPSSIAVAWAKAASADLRTFVTLHVNTIDQGETVAVVRGSDVLIPIAVLESAGVHGLKGKREKIRGQEYVSLASLSPDVTFAFNIDSLALDVTVKPLHLGSVSLNLANNRPAHIEYSTGSSSYLNYALTDASGGLESAFFDGGIGHGQDSFHYSFTAQSAHALRRGLIYYQMDDRETTVRREFGDLNANSGDLGGSMYLAGFGIARAFDLDPYAIYFPLPSLSGVATTPSVAAIYVNGVLVQRVNLPPGSFNLGNLPVTTGSANTQVVLTDAFGRTQTYSQNYYTAASLLKPGLTDYQFSAGLLRQNAFAIGDSYGPAAAVGRYRIGLNDSLTAGGRIEATTQLISGGPVFDFKLPVGYFHVALSASEDGGLGGAAASIGYGYSALHFGISLSALAQGPYYATISQAPALDRTVSAYNASGSLQVGHGSTVSVQYNRRRMRDSGTNDQLSVSDTLPLRRGYAFTLTAERDTSTNGAPVTGVTGMLNFSVGRADASITEQTGSTQDSTIAVQQSPAGRYGLGYAANYDPSFHHALNSSVLYRSQYGDAQIDYGTADQTPTTSALRLSGGIAAIGGGLYATRPVLGSYALVDVPGVPNVGVYYENELMGKTDREGKLLVPDLLPNFGNAIRIDDANVPINTSIQNVQQLVAPAAQAGALVTFAAEQLHALDGVILINLAGKSIVPEYGDLTLAGGDGFSAESVLGKNGEFYLENVPAGKYRAHVVFRQGTCEFDFVAPATDAVLVKLGTLGCAVP